MNKHKFIKSLIFANLFVICLTNCSLMPKSKQEDLQKIADSLPALQNPNKSLKNAKTISASPPWLAQLMKTARELGKDEEVSLFPAGMKDSYVPAKAPNKKKGVKIGSKYDKVLKGKLAGHGRDFEDAAQQYNIPIGLLIGISLHEVSPSGNSKMLLQYNNVAGNLVKNKKTGKWESRRFSSVRESIFYTSKNLRENYLNKGFTTISKIKTKYAPDKAENDPKNKNKSWANSVSMYKAKIDSI